MKKGARLINLILMCSLILCGCGTSLYELTDEEETVIIHYAAYALAKHNVYQKDGMVAIPDSLLEDESEEEAVIEEAAEETSTEETAETDGTADTASGTGESGEALTSASMSFAEAIGYNGILSVTYTGFYTINNFKEGKAYSLDARSGYEFVVAQFSVTNTTAEDVDVNVMKNNPTFRMSYDGSKRVKEDVTLLLTDLSTFTGTIAAGESVELVLLFEVPQEAASGIGTLTFFIDKDGENYEVK